MGEREERCETCKWWSWPGCESEYSPGAKMGDCSRYPPPLPPGEDDEVSALPMTWHDHSCGEWQARKPLPVVEGE